MILVHELGHFLTARLFNTTVNEFAIGMGPKLISKRSKKSGILYSVRAFPIGGFVSMAGEDEESDDVNSLNRKPVWQRMVITVAGAAMNLIIGFILMTVVVITSTSIGGTTILRFAEDNALSEQSGLMIGDEIVKVGDTRVHIASELAYEIMRNGVEPLDITVRRDGEIVEIKDVQFPTIIEQGIQFGMTDFIVLAEEKTVGNVIEQSFYRSISTVKMIWQSLIDLITGRYGLEQMSGPVGITAVVSEVAKSSFTDYLYLVVVITINLGIFNLLPLPALDGGRLIFQIIELIRRRPVKPEFEGYVHFVGIVLLMLLMVVITFKDVMNLFG
ncbi:MAG TPA: site-2 protease family protein [Firmicutes bacterium]|nr:site-2 protease family protein [Bacillota bacterium]